MDIVTVFLKHIPTLSRDSREVCEGKMVKEECYNVLKEMKLNKSLGNDGFTV